MVKIPATASTTITRRFIIGSMLLARAEPYPIFVKCCSRRDGQIPAAGLGARPEVGRGELLAARWKLDVSHSPGNVAAGAALCNETSACGYGCSSTRCSRENRPVRPPHRCHFGHLHRN